MFLSARSEYFINPHLFRSLHILTSQERGAETTNWTIVLTKMAVAQKKNGVLGFTRESGGVSPEWLAARARQKPRSPRGRYKRFARGSLLGPLPSICALKPLSCSSLSASLLRSLSGREQKKGTEKRKHCALQVEETAYRPGMEFEQNVIEGQKISSEPFLWDCSPPPPAHTLLFDLIQQLGLGQGAVCRSHLYLRFSAVSSSIKTVVLGV